MRRLARLQLASISFAWRILSAYPTSFPASDRRADSGEALQREWVRYATLAASSHNTQCWKFKLDDRLIKILPDLSRRCPAVDPDDHHLFVSLGCATENLLQAASANGFQGHVDLDTTAGAVVTISLEATRPVDSPLYDAIPERQCTRAEFDSKPVSSDALRMLEQAGRGDGVDALLFTGRDPMERLLEFVVAANTAQMSDRAFVEELKAWIRFNEGEAVRTGDGLFAGSTGNPSTQRWVGSPLFDLFYRTHSENDKYAKQIRSSAGIAIIVSDASDKAHWVEAGRCYQRFALRAASLGIRNALINQPVEVAAMRPRFAAHLGVGDRRPDLIVRFGYGPEMPRSLRRPLDAVIL